MSDTVSTLAQKLRPFWLRDLGASTPATTGGSGMIVHALNGPYHTGTLDTSQAPWFVTHAADANAHHNQVHTITGTDHTVVGSTYQIVGLTGTNTLGLLTPSASPGANAIVKTDGSSAVTLVDLTVSSDLFMTGTLDFGTNTITEDATYLQFAGSKALRFAQNMGNANWTLYTAGGYTTTGSISITGTAGDLDIGTHVLFVDNSQANVGINMAPDPQFALDINGPARATYWIGPHALQIKDAIMICHYDGRQPFNTNFYGEPNGHFGQVGTITGGVVFVAGKFGKALQVGWLCTNYFSDPSCEYDATLTQWSKFASSGTLTAERSTEVVSLYGSYVGKLVKSSGGTGLFYQSVTLPAGTAALTCYVRKADKSAVTSSDCSLYYGADQTTTYISVGDGWYRLFYQGAASGSATQAGLRIAASKTLYVDALQVEELRSSPYCDGSMGTGHAWTGTAYTSTSTRTGAALGYTLPDIAYDAPVTFMAWANLDGASSKNYHYLWYATSDAYSAYVNSSRVLLVGSVNCGTLPAGWVHIALATDGGGTVTAYVNGISAGTANITRAGHTSFNVGGQSGGNQCNGLIDDFAIIGRTLPAAEIRSIYESNAPIFAETSTFSFRPTPKGLIWADDEGLWMKDTSANPVFGIYGGESTKSWGGFTMAPGDLLIGNNAIGAAAILWDQSAGTFGFYGGGNATVQASVATDGSITAGAGALTLNANGIQITAPSAQSAIGSYKFYVTGKTITSGFSATYNSGLDTYYCGVWSNSSNIGNIVTGLDATIGGGGSVKIAFGLTNSLSTTSTQYTLSGSGIATWWFGTGTTNYVGINTASAPTRGFQVAGGVFAGGDDTGLAGYVQLTNSTQGVSSGNGTVKMNGGTARDSVGWLKLYSGTTAIYVPYWTTVTG